MYRAKTENSLIAKRKFFDEPSGKAERPNLTARLDNFLFFFSKNIYFSKNSCTFAQLNQKDKRIMEQARTTLNKAQMDILRLLEHIKTEEEAEELRDVISNFYARKAEEAMDRLWEAGLWDQEKNDAILKEHLRTPYKYAQ